MANKRDFKKYVDALGASACDSMLAAYYEIKDADKDKIEKAIAKVLGAIGVAKSNADITFDKRVKEFGSLQEYSKAKKEFFKNLFRKIYEDFTNELNEAIKELNDAVPQSAKEENKSALK